MAKKPQISKYEAEGGKPTGEQLRQQRKIAAVAKRTEAEARKDQDKRDAAAAKKAKRPVARVKARVSDRVDAREERKASKHIKVNPDADRSKIQKPKKKF